MKKLNKVKAPISAEGITQGKIYDVVCSTPNDITEYHFTIVDDSGVHIKCDLNNCGKLGGDSWIIVSLEEFKVSKVKPEDLKGEIKDFPIEVVQKMCEPKDFYNYRWEDFRIMGLDSITPLSKKLEIAI